MKESFFIFNKTFYEQKKWYGHATFDPTLANSFIFILT